MRHVKSGRFYLLWMEQDLLGQWGIYKISGRDGNHGRRSCVYCDSHQDALLMFSDLERSILQRGFIYDDLKHTEYFALRPQTIAEVCAL